MASSDDERRLHERYPIELSVEYKRVNTFFSDYAKNISRGGTFIATTRPVPIGTEFVFALKVPGVSEPLRLRGKVVWTIAVAQATLENPAGMGIEFQYSSDEERHEKEQLIRALLVEHLGEQTTAKIMARNQDR